MNKLKSCPICLSDEARITPEFMQGTYRVSCPICGAFALERNAYDDFLDPEQGIGKQVRSIDRARISHRILSATMANGVELPTITSDFIERFKKDCYPGPTPNEQAVNALRFIGNQVSKTGQRLHSLPINFFAVIGAANQEMAWDLLRDMKDAGLITCTIWKPEFSSEISSVEEVSLTLSGWKNYEEEQRGRFSGKYGFFALRFNDPILDKLSVDVIKPTIKSQLQFELFDMRDVARAGVIDNIMRAQIRDSAFVLVDLTHDNSGAYWEAGYAEGLGKPVIYLCERSKFDQAKTHFDTNHCTTVLWSADEPDMFARELIATLRRSLNLF